uniref:Uncharacterized protein n=2 Tax=Amphimedon queenslandica TaxID=400682 RepID=A0A1X7SRC3_AMPQE
ARLINSYIESMYMMDRANERPDVMSLLRERLPSYIVYSFAESGFDDIDAILEMDISDSPNNSIHGIQEYIESQKDDLPNCIRPNSNTCKFLPGHYLRVKRLVREIQDEYGEKPVPKKQKLSNSTSNSTAEPPLNNPITDIITEINARVTQWSRNFDNGRFNDIKENDHYYINVSRSLSDSSQFTVTLRCKCNATYTVQRKKTGSKPWVISNWCTHFQQCEDKRRSREQQAKQNNLSSYFSSSKPMSIETTPICQSSLSLSPEPSSPLALSPTASPLSTSSAGKLHISSHLDTQSTCIATTTVTTTPSVATSTSHHENQGFSKSPSFKMRGGATSHGSESPHITLPSATPTLTETTHTCQSPLSQPSPPLSITPLLSPATLPSSGQVTQYSINTTSLSAAGTHDANQGIQEAPLANSRTGTDWSRSARLKRKLIEAADKPDQMHITSYFAVADKISLLCKENQKLSLLLQQGQKAETNDIDAAAPILQSLLESAKRNSNK